MAAATIAVSTWLREKKELSVKLFLSTMRPERDGWWPLRCERGFGIWSRNYRPDASDMKKEKVS
jgi:hypothetical protein